MAVIVVGYSSRAEGRAALGRAISEAELRGADLVVVHTSPDGEVAELQGLLDASGVAYTINSTPDAQDPADELIRTAEARRRGVHRDRAAPPIPGRQAAARQQRPEGAARCLLPGAGGQGGA